MSFDCNHCSKGHCHRHCTNKRDCIHCDNHHYHEKKHFDYDYKQPVIYVDNATSLMRPIMVDPSYLFPATAASTLPRPIFVDLSESQAKSNLPPLSYGNKTTTSKKAEQPIVKADEPTDVTPTNTVKGISSGIVYSFMAIILILLLSLTIRK